MEFTYLSLGFSLCGHAAGTKGWVPLGVIAGWVLHVLLLFCLCHVILVSRVSLLVIVCTDQPVLLTCLKLLKFIRWFLSD